jgi:hypothetical protein
MRLSSSLFPSLLLLAVGGIILTTSAALLHDYGLRRRSPRFGFYESRPDDRKCASPYCGGFFVRPIDGSVITCPGRAAKPAVECYVGALRYSTIDESNGNTTTAPGISIVYGRILPGNYSVAPKIINDFDVRDGTKAAGSQKIILYYSVKRDFRKCAAPLCGGFWLKALATTKTLCSDGSVADECYVASLNLSGLDLTPEEEQVVLDGVVDKGGSVRGYYVGNRDYKKTTWPELKDLFVLESGRPAPY